MSSTITNGAIESVTEYAYGWEGTPGSSEAVERINGTIARRNLAVRRSGFTAVGAAEDTGNVVRPDGNWGSMRAQAGEFSPALRKVLTATSALLPSGGPLSAAVTVSNTSSIPQTASLTLPDGSAETVTLAYNESARLTVRGRSTGVDPQFVDLRLRSLGPRHAWEGTPDASPSLRYEDGVSTRRNLATAPRATKGWTHWPGSNGAANMSYLDGSGLPACSTYARATITTGATNSLVGPGVALIANVEAGVTYTFSFYGRSSREGSSAMRVRWTGGGSEVVGDFAPHAANTWERRSVTVTAPSTGQVTLYLWWNVVSQSGDTFDGTAVLVEVSPAPGSYFDGSQTNATAATLLFRDMQIEAAEEVGTFFNPSTPGRTDTTYATSRPLVIDGYQSTRPGRNIFHDVIGKAIPDASLFPAGPRTGRLTAVFLTEAEAVKCERMHLGTSVLTFSDSDVPSAGMDYVLGQAGIERELDPESRVLWFVRIAFQEVTR